MCGWQNIQDAVACQAEMIPVPFLRLCVAENQRSPDARDWASVWRYRSNPHFWQCLRCISCTLATCTARYESRLDRIRIIQLYYGRPSAQMHIEALKTIEGNHSLKSPLSISPWTANIPRGPSFKRFASQEHRKQAHNCDALGFNAHHLKSYDDLNGLVSSATSYYE